MQRIKQSTKDLLHKIAKEQMFVDYHLDIKEISSGGANYTSKLFAVSITEGSNKLRLFCKVAAMGEKMRTQVSKIYETEHFFYTNLGKIYRNIEDQCGIPDGLKLNVSKYYGSITELNEEAMVLQDLVAAGYEAYDRFKSIDWPYAQAATRELAKLHACAWAYGKQDPEGFDEILKKLTFDISMDGPEMKVYMTNMVEKAIATVREENKEMFTKYFESFNEEEYTATHKRSRRLVLNHGDFRPSNLMHKYLDDGSVDIKVVDLQTLQGGSPVSDLIYFIFSGSDEKFRAQYFDKLLDHYYTELSAAMKRLQLNPDEIFSREDFDYELNEKLPFGLTLATFIIPVVTVEMENAPQVDESLDISKFNLEKTSDLYAERLNGVVNDYVKIKQSTKDLFHKIAKEEMFVDYHLDIKEISSGGANYTSKLFAVSITEGSNILKLFCKVAAMGEKMRTQVSKIYETEHFFYTNLSKIYRNIEDQCGIPDGLKLNVSKYYGSITELNEEAMVLQDLVAAGYEAYDRFKSIDWPYAQAATRELAKLHACAWAYGKQDPEGFDDVTKNLVFDVKMEESETVNYGTKMIEKAFHTLNIEEYKVKLVKFFEAFEQNSYEEFQKSSRRQTLCHGDYKPSNLMHKILDNLEGLQFYKAT
uniref:SFRICE_008175 n=1 Tax=Spodoptera frugiperda TaxID=7108 RepID=A0A2H1VB90_SPOFR